MESLSEQIKKITGREIEFIETTFKGKKGFAPLYINHNISSRVSELMGSTEEEAQQKLLNYLKTTQGDTNEPTDTQPNS
jgi:hypothetical protein